MEILLWKIKRPARRNERKAKLNLVTNDNWIHKLEDYKMKFKKMYKKGRPIFLDCPI